VAHFAIELPHSSAIGHPGWTDFEASMLTSTSARCISSKRTAVACRVASSMSETALGETAPSLPPPPPLSLPGPPTGGDAVEGGADTLTIIRETPSPSGTTWSRRRTADALFREVRTEVREKRNAVERVRRGWECEDHQRRGPPARHQVSLQSRVAGEEGMRERKGGATQEQRIRP